MKITALVLLALGASAAAYVVPDNKQVAENAVEARMPASGPVRTSNLVAALAGRDIQARHHKGKGGKSGKKNNRRDVEELSDAADDAHWADLHVREPMPHHKGKGKKNNRREASPAPHHKGKNAKGGKKNNRREASPEPHHKGKNAKGGKNN